MYLSHATSPYLPLWSRHFWASCSHWGLHCEVHISSFGCFESEEVGVPLSHASVWSTEGNPPVHDQNTRNMSKTFLLGYYNCVRSALVHHNCSKLIVLNPFLAQFLLILILTLELHLAPFLQLGRGLVFKFVSYMLESYPSLIHSCDKYVHIVPLNYRTYKTFVVGPVYTSVTDDNCLLCDFLLPNRSCTRVWVPHMALLVPLVSIELVPLPSNSS